MASTYTQLNIHGVFTVKGRENILTKDFRYRLFEYISGGLKNEKQYPLSVGGYLDHIHIFFELHPTSSISTIFKHIKQSSSQWINDNKLVKGKFSWQEGYCAFSYSKSQRENVIQYIMKQEEHHKNRTFKEEYFKMLQDFDVEYNEKYLFDFYAGI